MNYDGYGEVKFPTLTIYYDVHIEWYPLGTLRDFGTNIRRYSLSPGRSRVPLPWVGVREHTVEESSGCVITR